MKQSRIEIPDWLRRVSWPSLDTLPSGLRDLPWISLGLVVAWILTTTVVELGYASRVSDASEAFYTAASLATREPIIEVSPRHMSVVRAVNPEFQNDTVLEFMRKKPATRDDYKPQEIFEGLAEDALAKISLVPYRNLGLVPREAAPHTFATHALVHSGFVHLFATIVLFLLASPLLEGVWGRRVLGPSLLLLTAIGGGTYVLVHGSSNQPLIGGGAIVTGLVAAVIARYREDEVDFLAWLSPIVDAELRAPAWVLLIPWAVYEAAIWSVIPTELPPGADNAIGFTAQAACALTGAGLGFSISKLGVECGPHAAGVAAHAAAASQKKVAAARRFDLAKIRQLRDEGEEDQALFLLQQEVAQNARNRDVVMTYWEMALERGVADEAAPALVRLLEEELRRGAHKVAAGLWRTLREKMPTQPISSPTLVRLAPTLGKLGGKKEAVAALEQALDRHNEGLTGALACQIARWSVELDTDLAGVAARRALESKDLDPKQRQDLEMLAVALEPSAPGEEKDDGKPPPPSAFFEESDRSAFGAVDDLSAFSAQSFPDGAVAEGTPTSLDGSNLAVDVPGQGPTAVTSARLRAISIVGVKGLGPKPVVILDLILDGAGTQLPLSVLRIHCSRYDPRSLVPDAPNGTAALRTIVAGLRRGSEAELLRDVTDKATRTEAIFESLDAYHEAVLRPVGATLA